MNYKDWAYLASMSDEQFKFAQDKHLFDNRTPNQKNEDYFDGESIYKLVNSLDDKGWENVEKRRLIDGYLDFNGWYSGLISADLIVSLAQMNDREFEKYNKLSRERTMYPETKLELNALPEEQYQRLFSRNLFGYQNTYESWDDWTQDAPIMKALAKLSDEEYQEFLEVKHEIGSTCKTIAGLIAISKARKLELDMKHNISELGAQEKRDYLQLLLNSGGIILSNDFQKHFKGSEIVPTNIDEYKEIMKKLVKSVGIDFKPIDEEMKVKFFNSIDSLYKNNEFKNLDIKNPDFKLTVTYPRNNFISDVEQIIKNLDSNEKMKVFDYFGFELKHNRFGELTMFGYPALINNDEKLTQINNQDTRIAINQIRDYVEKFTQGNKVLADGKFISQSMADTLNNILEILPELQTIIGKMQHPTHDYTIDVHSLAVLQECIKNPQFSTLSDKEKRILIFSSLLHDITKIENEIDKSHPKNSAYDAFYILEKLNLPKDEQLKVYQLIINHDMLEQYNKPIFDYSLNQKRHMTNDEQDSVVKNYAYGLRSGSLAKMELILTKSDLLSVQRSGEFYDKYKGALDKLDSKLEKEVNKIKSTQIVLPQTKIPKASQIKTDNVNSFEVVTNDKDGNPIKNKVIYLSPHLNLEQYGFEKGASADNFNVVIHGFSREIDQVVLDALDLANQNALLSASYVVYDKGNYHAFRPQGFIKEIPSENIGAAYFRDFGSGYKKDVDSLLSNYLNGSCYMYRNYIPKLIKQDLHLSDDEYIKLCSEIENKSLDVLERERPEVANAYKKIFTDMEIGKRRFQRDYNEILIEKGKNVAIFYEGTTENGEKYTTDKIPEYLRKYAQENDIPIIYFGE